jgi:hypothetical protein
MYIHETVFKITITKMCGREQIRVVNYFEGGCLNSTLTISLENNPPSHHQVLIENLKFLARLKEIGGMIN